MFRPTAAAFAVATATAALLTTSSLARAADAGRTPDGDPRPELHSRTSADRDGVRRQMVFIGRPNQFLNPGNDLRVVRPLNAPYALTGDADEVRTTRVHTLRVGSRIVPLGMAD